MPDFLKLIEPQPTIGALLSALVAAQELSLAALAKAAGLASKGYLSEVLRGKRLPKPVTAEALARALGLTGVPLRYFGILAARAAEADASKAAALDAELAALVKALHVGVAPMPEASGLSGFAIEVYCAFGLFAGKPGRQDLVGYFGKSRAFDVDRALHELARGDFVVAHADHYTLREDTRHFAFDESKGGVAHLEFLRHAITAAAAAAEAWFPRKADSHFEAMILSVRRADYRVALQRLKADLLAWESGVETHDADTLIRFNVQVHPLEDPSTS
jgi:transcriptional regulator with XRE-family HTH domain